MYKKLLASAVLAAIGAQASAEAPTFSMSDEVANVQNRCIVQFNDSVAANKVTGLANAMARRGNASVRHVYANSIKGFTVNMPCHAAERAFGGDAEVASLHPDGVVSASRGKPGGGGGTTGQVVPWSVTRVGGAVDGTGYTAWVVDSGIDLDHADLNIDAARGFSSICKGSTCSMDDDNGHGTHVAGTIAALDNDQDVIGVAAGATVVPVRVLDRRGSGSWSGVIAGVDHVAANAQPGDCVNMSLGGGVTQALDDAVIAAAQQSGAFFVLAAGNDGDDANNHSPARANGNNVYTISATDINDNLASWSNFGNPPVDYAAPGVNILSLGKGGGTATMSGTSMAAPAACAVIMMRNGNPSTSGFAGNDTDGTPDPIVSL
ncbi:S8 family serine peptidase [Umboniibacter marinipuniceus]|uniref:Subtilase family protein n=1 Tax=Umboniibacter marinipuniceus TaxID=569599 RepID=A0A3L9ZZU9_9GAMM|nr:S8 family serine peptidase [Umboniibacter marinipuniceus]RMA77644.1 subtilase family protein [Umboniibacter marinipuniceus]